MSNQSVPKGQHLAGVKTLEVRAAEDGFARSLYRHRVKPAIARIGALRSIPIENSIVLAGCPRGGTTWLGEILSTIPNSSVIFEPLDLDYTRELLDLGFTWRTYIPPGSQRPDVVDFFARLLTGKVRNARINNASTLWNILRANTLIVKSTRGQMLLHWLSEELNFAKPAIFLLRHPCAVVSSQIHWGYWADMEVPRIPAVLERYLEFSEILETVETLEEKLAALWSINVHVGLDGPKPLPFFILTYENLVVNGEAELHRLFGALDRPLPPGAVGCLRKASKTTVSSSSVKQGRPLEGWTKKLSPTQIDRVLRVVRDFGISFYDESLTPDEEYLQSLV